MAIKPTPYGAPGDEFKLVTPSDTADIPGIPTQGVKLHNYGTSGLVYVDGATSGTNIPFYIAQGGFAPILVRRVYATGLGAGVTLTLVY